MRENFFLFKFLKALWHAFTSVKLAVILIIAIAILSIVGTIIPQEDVVDISKIREAYSPTTFDILYSFGLFDIFHSWGFIAAMALLSINLTLCSLKQLPRYWRFIRNADIRLDHQSFQRLKYQATIEFPQGASVDNILLQAFKKYGLKPNKRSSNGEDYYFAQKHTFSRLGHLFTHCSIVIILLGVMISFLFSFKGYLGLFEGETADSFLILPQKEQKPLGFAVRVDKCEVIYYEKKPQQEKDWLSTLTIIEKGHPKLTKTIEVNHPLKYKGIYFYQEGFIPRAAYEIKRLLLSVEKAGQKQSRKEYAVQLGDILPYNSFTIKVLQFFPDLIIVEGEPKSKSNQLNNPAVKLEIVSQEGKAKPLWVFAHYPSMHQPEDLDIKVFLSIEADFYHWTRLQVVRDPGIPMVWVGCCLLGLAVISTFYFSHKRYWALITKTKSGRKALHLAGSAHRNQIVFARHFEAMAQEIKYQLKKLQ